MSEPLIDIGVNLTSKQFPMPHLIGTRRHNNSMLQVHGAVYELFEFVEGLLEVGDVRGIGGGLWHGREN